MHSLINFKGGENKRKLPNDRCLIQLRPYSIKWLEATKVMPLPDVVISLHDLYSAWGVMTIL